MMNKDAKKTILLVLLLMVLINICYIVYFVNYSDIGISVTNYIFSGIFLISLLSIMVVINFVLKKISFPLFLGVVFIILVFVFSFWPLGKSYTGYNGYDGGELTFDGNKCMYSTTYDMGGIYNIVGKCYKFYRYIVFKGEIELQNPYTYGDVNVLKNVVVKNDDTYVFKRKGDVLVTLTDAGSLKKGEKMFLLKDEKIISRSLTEMRTVLEITNESKIK